jgi:probable addiction module antidote protein
MALKTMPFDVADHLTDEETISAYLDEARKSGDERLIEQAAGDVARARLRVALQRGIDTTT